MRLILTAGPTTWAAFIVAFNWGASCEATPPRYHLSTLKPLSTGPNTGSFAHALNAHGIVVGASTLKSSPSDNGGRAARWDSPDEVTNLGFLNPDHTGSTNMTAYDVNSSSFAVGYGTDISKTSAVYWQPGQMTPTRLPELVGLGEVTLSTAHAVNDAGVIVGNIGTMFSGNLPVRWSSVTDEPTILPNAMFDGLPLVASGAVDINNFGLIVGAGIRPTPTFHTVAMVWDNNGTPIVLALPPHVPGDYTRTLAMGVSDTGRIVGHGSTDVWAGVLRWDSPSAEPEALDFYDLQIEGYSSGNVPAAINDQGVVVGHAIAIQGSSFVHRALLWDAGGAAYNLNDYVDNLGDWSLLQADDVNASGWIVGVAADAFGQEVAFLLVPVPEPSTIVLIVWLTGTVAHLRRRVSSRHRQS